MGSGHAGYVDVAADLLCAVCRVLAFAVAVVVDAVCEHIVAQVSVCQLLKGLFLAAAPRPAVWACSVGSVAQLQAEAEVLQM